MSLTNSKAILARAATVSLSLNGGLNYQIAAETIVGGLLISILVFSYCVIAFSALVMTRPYKQVERVYQALLMKFYGVQA